MSDFVVGLRGGIGTGKSTVSDMFAERGITVADADVSARRVVEPGRPAYDAIVGYFGEAILQSDGYLDRPRLREIVFSNDADRRFLESQTQKPIIQDLVSIVREATSAYAILVLSTGLGKSPLMQRLLVVDAPREEQIKRVMARDNNSSAQVQAILDAQPNRTDRVRDADDIISNDGNIDHLTLEVDRLHQLYLSLAHNRQPDPQHG